MNIIALPPLILTFIILFAGVFVFSQNVKHPVNQTFYAYSLITALYTFADYHYISTPDIDIAGFWVRVEMIWPLYYIVQLHFLMVFARFPLKVPKRWKIVLYTAGILVSLYFIFLVKIGIERRGDMWFRTTEDFNSTVQLVQMLFALPVIVITLVFGIRHVVKSKGRKKTQISSVLAGIMLPTIYSIVKEANPQTSAMFLIPISYIQFISWSFFVYAIRRYRLFNITPEYASHNIISTMKDGLVLLGENGRIIDSNEAFRKMFGLGKNETTHLPIERLLNKNAISRLYRENKFIRSEISNERLVHTNRQGQKLTLKLSGSVIRNYTGEKAGLVLAITDFTEYEHAREKLRVQQQHMANMAHRAGMAEVASNIMHNIGNVLNSIHISSEHISSILKNSKIKELAQINQLLKANKEGLAGFLSNDSKGKLIPEYLNQVAVTLGKNHGELKKESERLVEKINLIGESIELQQGPAKPGNFYEQVSITGLLDEVFKIMQPSFLKYGITLSVKSSMEEPEVVEIPKNKMFNVLLNIIKNAYESVKENERDNRLIDIRVFVPQPEVVQIDIADNGAGIAPENLGKLFNFGFTTKESGNGFGLHYCATAIQEMNGTVSAKSDGLSKGAVFSVAVPVKQPG